MTLDIPAGANFDYKYLRKNDGTVTWESDPNRHFTAPVAGPLILNDRWR